MRLTLAWTTLMALSWPIVAQASDITVIGRAAGWTAFTGLSNNGTPVCGILESGRDGRSFQIKSFEGRPDLTVQIFKPDWAIPPGARIPASIQFGGFSPWNAVAMGGGDMIEFKVPPDKIGAFTLQLRAADQFHLTFLTGNEAAWTGQLSGSGAVMDMFAKCVGSRRGPTQPFDRASPPPPTQPFSPGPAAPPQGPRFTQPRQHTV